MKIDNPISDGIKALGSLIDKAAFTKQERSRVNLELKKLESELLSKQAQTNIEATKTGSIFLAGWRPFLAWICSIAFAGQMLIVPILNNYIKFDFLPVNQFNWIMSLLMILVGARSVDKFRSRDTQRIEIKSNKRLQLFRNK